MIEQFNKHIPTKISDHFNSAEFDCHCQYNDCDITYIDLDLIEDLEDLRYVLNKPIHINSGFRCTRHNRDICGKKGSIHLVGKAADISIVNLQVKDYIELCDLKFTGIGAYKDFVHCDIRGGARARWVG